VIPTVALQIAGALQRVPAAVEFESAARNPARFQEALLRRILELNAGTELSRKHGLGDVKTRAELRARVPVTTYEDVRPYVDRQLRGEQNLMTAETPDFFAVSTGTTGTPKHTPMTPTYRRDFQRTLHVSMTHVLRRFPRAFTGNIAYSVGVALIENAPCGTPIGFTSGYNQKTLPTAVRRIFAWPHELAQIKDGPTRMYLAAWLTAVARVTLFTGIFPLAILLLLRAMEDLAEPLARDLRAGTLRDDLVLTPEQRAFYERFARADRAVADRIEAMTREAGGKMPLRAVLPDLRLVYCWTTGSASAFVPDLEKKLGEGVALRDAIYAANEGWGNCTFGEDLPGGPIALTSHVFEYIEESAWERGDRVGVGAEDLEVGKRYRLLVTNSGGLTRYDTADIVECSRFYHATPCIHFVRRAGAAFNLVGEKLVENNVVEATRAGLVEVGLGAAHFVAMPRYEGRPHWALAIELDADADRDRLERLRARVDRELGALNVEYGFYRTRTLGPLALHVITRGDSASRRRALIAAGKPEAQLKTVHLVQDDALLATLPIAQIVEAAKARA
jgi:hypothetical protein